MGAKDEHTLKAFVEAESYPGPSLIIAYSHCIAHGIALDTGVGARQQKLAVDSGQWLLYRYDPRRAERGENPLQLDSSAAKSKVQDFLLSENRFKMLTKSKPEDAKKFFAQAQVDADRRWKFYQFMAGRDTKAGNGAAAQPNRPPPWTSNRNQGDLRRYDPIDSRAKMQHQSLIAIVITMKYLWISPLPISA